MTDAITFINKQSKLSLDSADAKVVVVLHTNAGVFGNSRQFGIDFHANDGSKQPGCSTLKPKCSHYRAFYVFWSSVIPQHPFYGQQCNWRGHRCSSFMQIFGIYNRYPVPGQYYFATTDRWPYFILA